MFILISVANRDIIIICFFFRKSPEDNVNSAIFSIIIHEDGEEGYEERRVDNLTVPITLHFTYMNVSVQCISLHNHDSITFNIVMLNITYIT